MYVCIYVKKRENIYISKYLKNNLKTIWNLVILIFIISSFGDQYIQFYFCIKYEYIAI